MAQTEEGNIQSACCDYLARRRLFFFRLNNIPVSEVGEYGERRFRKMPKYTPKGLPDVIVVKEGSFIGLEFKGKGKDLSPEQVEIFKKITLAGGACHVIRSIDDLQAIGL